MSYKYLTKFVELIDLSRSRELNKFKELVSEKISDLITLGLENEFSVFIEPKRSARFNRNDNCMPLTSLIAIEKILHSDFI